MQPQSLLDIMVEKDSARRQGNNWPHLKMRPLLIDSDCVKIYGAKEYKDHALHTINDEY